ncbi:YibE/F-like protein [Butyrivibrio proteoclasticus B316]|uniref:YibE/F-like protein n=1 Tax=Butyrivibrio proteoclasticus (strain ATCC 51982 / DSM 14932 / B316) TaxID=515622 RepID=E0RXH3_BUTPB|nr:YibE/F family protein [Butyrivibrio proteoclasticus]ADL33011.1 YibE/F-like protein [Butyrivibrio proteoclasticus B316]
MGNVRGTRTLNSKWDFKRIVAIFVLMAIFVVSVCFIRFGLVEKSESSATSHFVRATVSQLIQDNTQKDENTEGILRGSQEVIVQISSGPFKGKKYQTTNYLSALFNINAQEGTRVIVRLDPQSDGYSAFIYSYDRTGILLVMFGVFALSLILIGRSKGAMALVSLIFTLFAIVSILFPLLEYGFPAIPATILIVFYTTVFTFVLIDGINKKTISGALGTLAGVLIASIFAAFAGFISHISGFQTNEAEELLLIGTDHGMKISGLFTAGILIASLGAVMDVAMSIASAVHELHEVNDQMSAMELFRSGMNIGRDAMGTMANTLILAFAGSSFTLLLLIYYYNIGFTQLINTDMVAREVIQGLSGSIGIVLTVPIVAFLSATIETYKRER